MKLSSPLYSAERSCGRNVDGAPTEENESWSAQGVRLAQHKIYKVSHTFLREYSYKRLKLAQLLGQRGVFLTCSFD